MKWEPLGYVSISLKNLRKTMKLDDSRFSISFLLPTITLGNYIYEMVNEMNNVIGE